MRLRRGAAGALALLVLLTGCRHRSGAPPFPLEGEAHVEPDLVGVVHVVKRGETLYRIAGAYGVSQRDLLLVNGLRSARALEAGTELFVPGATRIVVVPPAVPGAPPEPEVEDPPRPERTAQAGKVLRWPLRGVLYSRFGPRQGARHDGIDIAAPEGTPVLAAADGTVLFTGQQSGYGTIVILRHPGDLLTLYAHASAVLVREGDRVRAGQPVARVGQTGRTTGPHLHFEVREGTRPRDPLQYLQ